MKKIAVIVEGSSDQIFWDKVLNAQFAHQCRFTVMNQKGRSKVIESAGKYLDACRRGGYASLFFLVDLDDKPCVSAVRALFAQKVQAEATQPLPRYVHICVAKKEFEAWLLADEDAFRIVLPKAEYVCDRPTDSLNAERKLTELLERDRGPGAGFRKPAFARELAPCFAPERAVTRSHSFAYFWGRLCAAVAGSTP